MIMTIGLPGIKLAYYKYNRRLCTKNIQLLTQLKQVYYWRYKSKTHTTNGRESAINRALDGCIYLG
jgi:hypothetical protein